MLVLVTDGAAARPENGTIGETQSSQQENEMAKGKLKGNKEARKPKTEKPKGSASAYKQAQSKAGVSTTSFVRRIQLG
jgi:hypothetical protein